MSRLKQSALGVLLFAVLIVGLQVFVLRPAKERSKARVCMSHFKMIFVASKNYAREHRTGYQTNLICLSNEINSPRMLLCVDDELRSRRVREKVINKIFEGYGSAGHWARLTMDDCSYEVSIRGTNTLVLRCPIHKVEDDSSWWDRNEQ